MRKWLVKVRVPGPGGETTSSEQYLVEGEDPHAACEVVNKHLASDDMVGGDMIDVVSIKESTIHSLIKRK